MNRFCNTLIITFLLVLLIIGCSNGSQSEAEYFDPMNKYIAELSESNFSPAQISSNSLDTSSHANMLANLNTLTPPKLYANTHKSLIDQIETWNSNASKASAALTKTEAEILKLAKEIELNINNVVTCETASALNAAYAEQQFSNMQNFVRFRFLCKKCEKKYCLIIRNFRIFSKLLISLESLDFHCSCVF